jgi:alpha-glucosidase
MKLICLSILCTLIFSCRNYQEPLLQSPDGAIEFKFELIGNVPVYSIWYKDHQLIRHAAVQLVFEGEDSVLKNTVVRDIQYREDVEKYELIVGKARTISHPYHEVLIALEEAGSAKRQYNLRVRAFNDGLAFRYELLEEAGTDSFSLKEERTEFRFVDNPRLLTLFLPNFTTSHEGEYSLLSLSEAKPDTLMDVPTLVELPNNTYMAITEAALLDYAGMYLKPGDSVLRTALSPRLDDPGIAVKGRYPHHSPWRVMLISDRLGALLESNMITSLNEPSRINDLTWIKPGKATFPWWNGSIIPDTSFPPGNNFENNKYYIDFCARNGIEYHSVVESQGHEWYVNDGEGYQPGPNAEVTKPVAGIDMKAICDYATSKGVKVRVWVHWKALYPKIDTAFRLFEEWGLTGMMVDFMDRDDQEMIRIKEEILQKAAKHKLHIQFHGVEKPTGLSRTYPNEWTREGTLNYEVNKWDRRVTPDHDLNIVFTRLIAGPADYHLGGFRAAPDSLWRVQYERPLMMGTRCHMLAMYVVLESYLGMVCDYPAAYEGQPGFEFIRQVPTVWDQTKVVQAELGKYVCIARQKDRNWYVGAINNSEAREISVPLTFLGPGEFDLTIYRDGSETEKDPNKLEIEKMTVTRDEVLKVKMAAGGGMAMRIVRRES